MAFIDKEDYSAHIRENILDSITEVDDDILEKCAGRAISYVIARLNSRYDTDNIFNKTGSARHEGVLGVTIDIALFFVHQRLNYNKIPKARTLAYNEAKEWLKDIQELKNNPPDLPLLATGDKDFVVWGSNPKRENHI